ncbi:MAG TPA: hypothetical protein VGY57_00665, partial [Vicinamibacterales bacterium]|nr:hypothetical protein [Vicinamibacterales bacterium]
MAGAAFIEVRTLTGELGEFWRQAVERSPQARLAHAPAWHAAIARAYGHTPLYLAAIGGGDEYGVLPAFIVRRPLVGAVVTSMPFLDSGGPCASSPAIEARLVDHLVASARAAGARFVELRSAARLP